jgi:hypothetical protein
MKRSEAFALFSNPFTHATVMFRKGPVALELGGYTRS